MSRLLWINSLPAATVLIEDEEPTPWHVLFLHKLKLTERIHIPCELFCGLDDNEDPNRRLPYEIEGRV